MRKMIRKLICFHPTWKIEPVLPEDMTLWAFFRTRLISPKSIIKELRLENAYFSKRKSIKDAIFFARYAEGKSIEGYDYEIVK